MFYIFLVIFFFICANPLEASKATSDYDVMASMNEPMEKEMEVFDMDIYQLM